MKSILFGIALILFGGIYLQSPAVTHSYKWLTALAEGIGLIMTYLGLYYAVVGYYKETS